MANNLIIVGLGEILWDMLSQRQAARRSAGKFRLSCQMLGHQGIIASRVGSDDAARKFSTGLESKTSNRIHPDDELLPTGTVAVEVDEKGQPKYTITEEVAWDCLEWNDQWEDLAKKAKAVCFGSLAQRAHSVAPYDSQILKECMAGCSADF